MQYPHSPIPITCFYPSHIDNLPVVPPNSLHTMATMPVTQPCEVTYFGHRLTLSPPTLAPNAVVIITNRQEQVPLTHPENLPANRAEADAQGFRGATQEEWDGLNKLRSAAIGVATPRAGSAHENAACLENPLLGSERWDHVVNRMHAVAHFVQHPDIGYVSLTWFASMYTPGMFSGFWLGRIVVSLYGWVQSYASQFNLISCSIRMCACFSACKKCIRLHSQPLGIPWKIGKWECKSHSRILFLPHLP